MSFTVSTWSQYMAMRDLHRRETGHALSAFQTFGDISVSCTDRFCEWVPPKRDNGK